MRRSSVYSRPTYSRRRRAGASWFRRSYDEILTDYPFLEQEDILAAIDYAAHQTDHIVIQAS